METIFFNAAGTVLFVRDDMETGHWVQEEMNVTATFPFLKVKPIERGQRIAFHDPATDDLQVFEIRTVTNTEPDHYQQITAEHIALAELQDEHINSTEITDKTALQALTTALSGTLWSAGNSTASGAQSADFGRGSVWDAVSTIQENWNVYVIPRVTYNATGITGRYLDIIPADGIWRGVRLSAAKNMTDPAVEINDEEVLTALYGYGGNVNVSQASGDDTTEELTFKDEVWTQTAGHPAKPSGQTYLEWPEKTTQYGRNGRPRYGYYQNGNIKDASVLLQKTWEALQKTAEPKISITGTVTDLYRLGYKDQPLRLHDMAIVEIEDTGEVFQKEIINLDVDLLDPTGSRVGIGDYIPNIVYINRDTSDTASSGGGGGGSGSRGMTNLEDDEVKAYTTFFNTTTKVGMIIGTKDGVDYVNAPQISLALNEWGGTRILLKADTIDIDGVVEALTTKSLNVVELSVTGEGGIYSESDIETDGDISCAGSVGCNELETNGILMGNDPTPATWQSYQARFTHYATGHYYIYSSGSGSTTPYGVTSGRLMTSWEDTTLHYLGKAST